MKMKIWLQNSLIPNLLNSHSVLRGCKKVKKKKPSEIHEFRPNKL